MNSDMQGVRELAEYWALTVFRDDKIVDERAFVTKKTAEQAMEIWSEAVRKMRESGIEGKWSVRLAPIVSRRLPRQVFRDGELSIAGAMIKKRARELLAGGRKKQREVE
ncbi:MAG TPA: hypothetical protein VEH08_03910 [Methanomassiliicoccales archaeon]|nr:hypothetical protein [Methanomassiliicoccales archaeon]